MLVGKVNLYKFNELDENSKENAINHVVNDIAMYTNVEELSHNSNLYKAFKKAEEMHCVWFTGSFILEMCKPYVLKECKQLYYYKNGDIAEMNLFDKVEEFKKVGV